jgi:hypothetical protein
MSTTSGHCGSSWSNGRLMAFGPTSSCKSSAWFGITWIRGWTQRPALLYSTSSFVSNLFQFSYFLLRITDTCTLSNGNLSLLGDLRTFSGIPFTHLLSAEMFGTYKPSPKVYLGAAEKLELHPNQCVMVAAHLNDLKAAKENGLQTVYVERPDEEDWGADEVEQARQGGWVDLWISSKDGSRGFITVAEKLGIDVTDAEQTAS